MSRALHAELANGFGNLASRGAAMVGTYFDGCPARADGVPDAEHGAADVAGPDRPRRTRRSRHWHIHDAIGATGQLVDAVNVYITEQEPWVLAKDEADRARLGTVLYTICEGCARSPCCTAGDAEGHRRSCGSARRRRRRSAGSATSRDRRRALGSAARRGAKVTKGANLFPRIEETAS